MHTEASMPALPLAHFLLFAAWGCPSLTCSVECPMLRQTQILFSPAFSAHPPSRQLELHSRGDCRIAQQCLPPLAWQVLALCVTLSVTTPLDCVTPPWGGPRKKAEEGRGGWRTEAVCLLLKSPLSEHLWATM